MVNKYIRKSRKACLKQKGEYNFGFDEFHEFCIYKYVMGIKMKKKEYKGVCEHNRFNSYKEWKTYILEKYENMYSDDCEEFKKFLLQKSKNKKVTNKALIMVLSILFTAPISRLFDSILTVDKNPIIMLVGLVVYIGVIFYIIYMILKPHWDENETSSFYEDYISAIDELISHNDKDEKKIPKHKNNRKTSSSQNGRRNKNTNYSNTH